MSYPYYYPCYSARLLEPTIHAQHTLDALHRSYLREEQIRIQQAARVGDQVCERQRVLDYEQELKDKQRMQQIMERSRIQADIEQSKMRLALMSDRTREDYLKGIGLSHRQYRGAMYSNRAVLTGRKREDEKQRQMLVESYQRELLDKIRGDDNKKKEEGKNVHLGKTLEGGSQPIINRKINEKVLKQACQFSNSAINATLQQRTTRDKDIDNSKSNKASEDDTPLKDKYMTHRYSSITNDKKHNKSLTARRIQQKRNKFNSVLKDSRTQNAYRSRDISERGLKRIQNRLKVSAIIYKDSSRRNNKHQMQHLCNTYQNQLRLRNEMKDRINTNPQILKKHHMVVPVC